MIHEAEGMLDGPDCIAGYRHVWHSLQLPSFSSKRGHVTEKHVLNGCKRDKLGNQTFEVLQLLKRTVYTIPLTYFT